MTVASASLTPQQNVKNPVCETYGDITKVLEFEKAMRVYRARTEPFQINQVDKSVFGLFEVISGNTSSLYFVDIFDNKKTHDTCTCKDFLSNFLNTCKHIQAVYSVFDQLKLTKEYNGGLRLTTPYLTLLNSKVVLIGNDASIQYSDGEIVDYKDNPSLRVSMAVPEVIEKTKRLQGRKSRINRMSKEVENGNVNVDVLLKPLFPYQQDCVKEMVVKGRLLLALRMGGGKTPSAIATCETLKITDDVNTVLLIVPASLKQQWANEIEIFTGTKAEIVHKTDDFKEFLPAAIGASIQYKIVNYELLLRVPELLPILNPDVIVCDEAQKIKNFRSKTADAIKQISSKFIFALTGTPIENRLDDLYSIIQLIDEDLFGPLWKFNYDFHEQSAESAGRIVGCKNLDLLRYRIKDRVFSKNRTEILAQMPPLFEEFKFVPMSDEQAECEAEYRHQAAILFAKAASKGLTRGEQQMLAGFLLKARQACDSVALCDPDRGTDIFDSPKLDELKLLIEEICINDKSKVVIFSEWVEMLAIIAKVLDKMGVGHVTLNGGIQTKKRPPIIKSFEDNPDKFVLLASDAGGTGLNLQFASYVIHFDLPWNPAKLDQRTARTHRLGQKNKVYAYYFCAETGIERGIKDVLESKRDVRMAALEADSQVQEIQLQSFVSTLKENTDMFALPVKEEVKVAVVSTKPKIDTRVRQIIEKMAKFKTYQKDNEYKLAIHEAHNIILLMIGFIQKLEDYSYETIINLIPKKLMAQNRAYIEAHGILISLHHFMGYKGDVEKLGQIYLRTTILRARKAIDSLLDLVK